MRLIYEILLQEVKLPINVCINRKNHPLRDFYFIHQPTILDWLKKHWASCYCCVECRGVISTERVRNYFGESIAYYFEFMRHYTLWLHFPAFVGCIINYLQVKELVFIYLI